MAHESQTKKIWKALKRGRRLTMDSIRALCGSLNGHKRIRELERQHGVTIPKRTIKRNGRKLTQWYMA